MNSGEHNSTYKTNINYVPFWLKAPSYDFSKKECGIKAAKMVRQKGICDTRNERISNYFTHTSFHVKFATLGREINQIIN